MPRKNDCCPKDFHPKIGALVLCKVAGVGVPVDTLFEFTVDGGPPFDIPAGAGPDGNCVALGNFPTETEVTIQETVPGPGGAGPQSIVVDPPANEVSTDLVTGVAVVRITGGTTTVTYTNEVQA